MDCSMALAAAEASIAPDLGASVKIKIDAICYLVYSAGIKMTMHLIARMQDGAGRLYNDNELLLSRRVPDCQNVEWSGCCTMTTSYCRCAVVAVAQSQWIVSVYIVCAFQYKRELYRYACDRRCSKQITMKLQVHPSRHSAGFLHVYCVPRGGYHNYTNIVQDL